MQIDLKNILNRGETIAVALSGGCDSMSLLYYLQKNADIYGIKVIALNVEHGIRGESSIADSLFVKKYCDENGVKLLTFSVDSPKYAKENKLSIEQSARILRYDCFKKAIDNKECDKIATAHHRDDNVETVLFNLFRGTGLKGLTGIVREREDKIIRPFLSIDRKDIEKYAQTNSIPFVTDQTNFSDDYTRNYLRHNVVPQIKKLFPELNQSIERLSLIVNEDQTYLDEQAKTAVNITGGLVQITLPCSPAILSRATIIALKALGVKKDWTNAHIENIKKLATLNNGAIVNLLQDVTAIKEYDKIVLYKPTTSSNVEKKFKLGNFIVEGKQLSFNLVEKELIDLKTALYADLDKIPKQAVIRNRSQGDVFKKFGGGSKTLGDYLTDIKYPLRARDELLLLADGKKILAILGVAISDNIKVTDATERVIHLGDKKLF